MASLNKVMLIGRLTDNPEPAKILPNSGTKVVKFRFAVGRSRKNPQTGQWESDPNPLYIDCEAFNRGETGKLADLAEAYLTKGKQCYLEGRLQLDTWDDKQTGQKRSKHKVVVDTIQFLDGGAGGGEGGEVSAPRSTNRPASAPARSAPASTGRGNYDEMDTPSGESEDIPF